MDATTSIAFFVFGFLLLLAILSCLDSAKVTALKDQLHDLADCEQAAWKAGWSAGWKDGAQQGFDYGREPLATEFQHVGAYIDEGDE